MYQKWIRFAVANILTEYKVLKNTKMDGYGMYFMLSLAIYMLWGENFCPWRPYL